MNITAATYCIAQGGTIGEYYRSHLLYCSPKGGPLVILPQPLTVSQPKGGTIGGYYRSHLHVLYRSPKGGPLVDIRQPLTVSQPKGGTIGEHYRSHLHVLYRSPKGGPLVDIAAATYCIAAQRGDHWWILPQPLTVSQPKGGTIGEHYRSHLHILYRSPKGGPLVDITAATYCIAAQKISHTLQYLTKIKIL